VRRMKSLRHKTWLEIGLREGRKHVVRRLCAALGLPVDKLIRIRLGPVTLGDLAPGAWRDVTPTELGVLRRGPRPPPPPRRGAAAGPAGRAAGTPAHDTPPAARQAA